MSNANYSSDKVGVQGLEGSVGVTWEGDWIAQNGWGHSYIVVDIHDSEAEGGDGDGVTDYDEIYVSSHTNNRLHSRLLDREPDQDVHFMWIVSFKNP